jgi:hypothetical protein
MMQLLRDEHGLIGSFVKAQIANEKNAIDKSANEKKQLRAGADDGAAPVAVEAQPGAVAALRPTAIVAMVPGKPAPARAKPPVVGASLPALASAPAQQSENAPPPPARSDDSLLARTIGFKDNAVAVTQRAVAAIAGIPSWFGAIGDRIGGEDPSPRPPAHLISEL